MVLRRAVIALLISLCAFPNPAWGAKSPSNAARTLFVYPGNHGFLHQTGYHVPQGWAAMHRIHAPGYLIEGQISGGEALPPGIYRYEFVFTLLPGQHAGLLSKANDVVRIEAWDATAHLCLMNRTFQVADFVDLRRHQATKSVTFSTHGRAGHRFQPRIYWPGLSGVFLHRVRLQELPNYDITQLEKKAERFEQMMGEVFLDRGYVVSRGENGSLEDVGDAAIWTGMYAASQAWRYKATHSPLALKRMHESLQALHELHRQSPRPGTLIRYIYPEGKILKQAASKDTYTGFYFALGQCLPYIRDRQLRKNLIADADALTEHFMANNLAFIPPEGTPVDMQPSISTLKLAEVIEGLRHDAGDRQRAIRLMEAIHLYFMIHAQSPWPELQEMMKHLKRQDFDAVHRDMVPFLNGALRALEQIQRNVHKSAIQWRWKDAPYQKLDLLLLQMIKQLTVPSRAAIRKPEELKFLSSQSIHALHFLKVAGLSVPRPNNYARTYKDNLWQNEALLKTAQEWNGMDENLIAAVTGHTQAAVMRGNSNHLSFLALFNLYQKERNAGIRAIYRNLFEQQYLPQQAEYNAMLHIMQPIFQLGPEQTGLGLWALSIYPESRRGRGEVYWQSIRKQRFQRYGGEVSGKARDPIAVDELQRDSFIWQRSARSMRGDDANKFYPPLDYLFVYWMARANNQIK